MLVFFDSIGVGIFDILSTAHVLSSSAVIGYVLDIGHLEPTYHSLSFLPFLFVSVMNNRFQVWIHVLSEVLLHSQTTRIHDVFQREEGGGGWRRVVSQVRFLCQLCQQKKWVLFGVKSGRFAATFVATK